MISKNPPAWRTVYGFPQIDNPTTHAVYKSYKDGAEVSMVDINGTRRYFAFKNDGEIHIINNVAVFDSDWAEELAIDESKQFPRNS